MPAALLAGQGQRRGRGSNGQACAGEGGGAAGCMGLVSWAAHARSVALWRPRMRTWGGCHDEDPGGRQGVTCGNSMWPYGLPVRSCIFLSNTGHGCVFLCKWQVREVRPFVASLPAAAWVFDRCKRGPATWLGGDAHGGNHVAEVRDRACQYTGTQAPRNTGVERPVGRIRTHLDEHLAVVITEEVVDDENRRPIVYQPKAWVALVQRKIGVSCLCMSMHNAQY